MVQTGQVADVANSYLLSEPNEMVEQNSADMVTGLVFCGT
jgi:hypothetical protein